jgi:hypothetical protein
MGNSKSTPKSDIMSDEELMKEVINLLAEEERWVQAITGLLTFGVMKYIVVPLLQDLNDFRKSYLNKPPTSPLSCSTSRQWGLARVIFLNFEFYSFD